MDIKQLKEHLIDNTYIVEELLEKYFYNVKFYESSEQWRCGFTEDCNPNSIRISSKDLSYKDYKLNDKGDIFSLVMRRLNINLGKCLDIFSKNSNFEEVEIIRKEVYGGFFKTLSRNDSSELFYYNEGDINKYPEIISKLFLGDGVTIEAQQKFNIRYDSDSNRIIIPVYLRGKLVGAIGRYNNKEIGSLPKYLPILRYPKNKIVFGYDLNYSTIQNNRVYIVESEKTVIKCYGEGLRNLLAVGGNNISRQQKELIYSLNPTEIVVVLDKGLGKERADELNVDVDRYLLEVILKECEKLKTNNVFLDFKVGYINCNNIEEVSDKDNIFDLDINNYSKYLNQIEYL